ncbi:hypothetical protein YC2023_108580 [Brassica napus]
MDCSGDFGPRGLSVQYTQDVRGCLSAHTGRPCVSVTTHRTSMAVHWCSCVSVSTHRTSVAVNQYTYQHVGPWTQHAEPSRGLFGTHRTSVAVRVCLCVSVSTQRPSVAVHQYTYQHAGHTGRPWVSASTHRTSVGVCQHTQDVRGCPSAHTEHLWLSVCVRHDTQDVSGCPSVHISARCTHRTSVGVRQHTQDVRVCPSAHTGRPCVSVSTHRTSVAVRVCPSAHTRCLWLSICIHISTLALGLSTLTLPVDCSGDFGPRGLSVQYTEDVCGCPIHISTLGLRLSTLALPVDCLGDFCPCGRSVQYTHDVCVSVSTHRTSVCVRQHTHDVRGCPSAYTGRTWLSVCVRVCPSAHTGRLWLSISTHISTLVLGLSTLTLPVDCLGDFGPRGLSVQYTQDVCGTLVHGISTLALPVDCLRDFGPRGLSVQYTQDIRGCPPTHTGRPWVSVCVRLCPTVSVSTHRTSMAVHQYTYQHVGPWTQHAGPSRGLFGLYVAIRVCPCVSGSTHRTSVAVHHTHRTSACPSAHTGHLCVSVSTHMTYVAVRVCPTLTLLVDCLGDFGPRGLSVQYKQDVRGCPPAHTGRPWLSVCVRVCPSVSVSTHRTSVADHRTHRSYVGVRQHTQDVRGCPWLSVSTHRTSVAVRVFPCVSVSTHRMSVAVRVCPSEHTGRLWLSISTHLRTFVLGLSTLVLFVDCLGDFGPRGLSVQYTQDVRGCPTHISTLVLGLSTLVLGLSVLALPVDCSGDFGPRRLSVQYT